MNLTERYFRLLGWEHRPHKVTGTMTWVVNGVAGQHLPNILEHFPSFKKFVIEEMEREGYEYSMYFKSEFGDTYFIWILEEPTPLKRNHSKKIKDNEILTAAVEAACDYLKSKEGEG